MGTSRVTARGSAEASPLSLPDTVASPTGAPSSSSSSSSRGEGAPHLVPTDRGREHPRSSGSVAAPPPSDDYTRVRDAEGSTARLSV
uniref:Uncharacterized protein n=1 Tax=Chromera velia CCMP2878 TaxID=1169474 RepID=A0A0G4IA27_9ALVE|eukprot:Cvel_12407.t1-p1 / transcript=Cvel_12407.t1 / gene=Cvel_12407 / organism=Chromera_velia_CCMP2878 / gene_product=hypothetical protein / transcript_product=hypothetical protein / location=Cvel_scaffold811:51218-51475(+) / protein_length=86 / sequence_SO=supercontig / SO=protein_coding / is_pseudo=false